MPYDPVDPASLEGEALMRWYRRTPQEIEEERRRASAEAYNRFFYPTQFDQVQSSDSAAPDDHGLRPDGGQQPTRAGDGHGETWPAHGLAPSAAPAMSWPSTFPAAPGTGLLGDWRRYAAAGDQYPPTGRAKLATDQDNGQPNYRADYGATDGFPENPTSPQEAYLIQIGNPHNPRLRRQWEKANGQPWPKADDGRNYHVAHQRAIADGGTNTLDNINPMHPDEHIAKHLNDGDSARWGKRASIARAFGGTVEPPNPGRTVRGLGALGIIPWITGLLSGHIRTDTPTHTWYDMAGFPSPDDYDQMVDPSCRAMGINTPGGKCT